MKASAAEGRINLAMRAEFLNLGNCLPSDWIPQLHYFGHPRPLFHLEKLPI